MHEFAPPTDCTDAREAVSARLDGELAELDGARLDAHLRGCAACGAFADGLALTAAALRSAPLETAPPRAFVVHRRRYGGSAAAVAAAAALLVAAAAPSFLAGKLFGDHAGHHTAAPARVAAKAPVGVPENGIDPGIVAMLVGEGPASGRIVPL